MDKYYSEIVSFHKNFDKFKDKKIVLYGIGRMTMTLLNGLTGFNIVGLMDKSPENIGKEFSGIRVISKEEASKCADIIVINTSGTYWNLIYERIKDIGVPVYFLNGQIAEEEKNSFDFSEIKDFSLEDFHDLIGKYDVISFDFFGTLCDRIILNPGDLFKYVEYKTGSPGFEEKRKKALTLTKPHYTLDDVYKIVENSGEYSHSEIEEIKKCELNTEQEFLRFRNSVINEMSYSIDQGKEVYIVSDMYLPSSFFVDSLKKTGISLNTDHVIVSCEKEAEKKDGTLWDQFISITKGNSIIHIGDDPTGDIEQAGKHGIRAYRILGNADLIRRSFFQKAFLNMNSAYAEAVMGLVASRMIDDPYSMVKTNGRFILDSREDMGYCVFGPVILSFFYWIMEELDKDYNSERLVFVARDGYFLEKDFELFCDRTGFSIKTTYLGISRQLAMISSISSEEDMSEYFQMPYTGTVSELIDDRFGIHASEGKYDIPANGFSFSSIDPDTGKKMWKRVNDIKENYREYLKSIKLNDNDVLIDTGYYGNNQRYLNKITGHRLKGYYMTGDLSPYNPNAKNQTMKVCFSNSENGNLSKVKEGMLYLESLLTAPYGMIEEISADGVFKCKKNGKNQECFDEKRQINEGIRNFIIDFTELFGQDTTKADIPWVDLYYGICFNGGLKLSEEIKNSFYNDNRFMNRFDQKIFN